MHVQNNEQKKSHRRIHLSYVLRLLVYIEALNASDLKHPEWKVLGLYDVLLRCDNMPLKLPPLKLIITNKRKEYHDVV